MARCFEFGVFYFWSVIAKECAATDRLLAFRKQVERCPCHGADSPSLCFDCEWGHKPSCCKPPATEAWRDD